MQRYHLLARELVLEIIEASELDVRDMPKQLCYVLCGCHRFTITSAVLHTSTDINEYDEVV